jgi:hypothetical protein
MEHFGQTLIGDDLARAEIDGHRRDCVVFRRDIERASTMAVPRRLGFKRVTWCRKRDHL